MTRSRSRQKMVILANYVAGQSYGLMGPQLAATIISEQAGWDCLVVGVGRHDDPAALKKALDGYFGPQRPVVAFSTLAGRPDLFDLAAELKHGGARTLLAGPQADVDFAGESNWQKYSHRFRGLHEHFALALQGPAEQILPWLHDPDDAGWKHQAGFVSSNAGGRLRAIAPAPWTERYLEHVRWHNLFRLESADLLPAKISSAQVLQQIGCPYAAKHREVLIDSPSELRHLKQLPVTMRGCAFCDVATDKGFTGALSEKAVLAQIASLPEDGQGRKICFELINENPLPGLSALLEACRQRDIELSQINLTLRADYLSRGETPLRRALKISSVMQTRILLSSVGFESFDDTILKNLNKGLNVETNLSAVQLIRQLKSQYPQTLGYLRQEGGNHGFIHPTPWDSEATENNIRRTASIYNLHADILPSHSTPLIIHHASSLGRWARLVESSSGIRYPRLGSIIAWWEQLPPSSPAQTA